MYSFTLIFKLFLKYFFGVNVLPAFISVHHVYVWHLKMPKELVRSPSIGITESYELSLALGTEPRFL